MLRREGGGVEEGRGGGVEEGRGVVLRREEGVVEDSPKTSRNSVVRSA